MHIILASYLFKDLLHIAYILNSKIFGPQL